MLILHLVFLGGLYVLPWGDWNILWSEKNRSIIFWFFILYWMTGLGITMGYHRLWSHRTFKTTLFVEWILVLLSSMALQNSALKWCSDHRRHHAFTDTEKDPYDATCGFLWSHLLWIFFDRPDEKEQKLLKERFPNVADLIQRRHLVWQHRYYFLIGPLLTFGIPIVLGFFYGDVWNFFLWTGVARLLFVYHSTFFINSLAHSWGKRTYSNKDSAKDSFLCAVLALGEGYHNYHHTYPQDYRNGIRFYHFDPTKWVIRGLSWVGLTWDLKKIPYHLIQRGKEMLV
jgi:stearoyl-CoA desaturase (delta-9 desaturase)